ncbi:hypothetical protein WJX79_000840 [Trebouxia sp. C0005]|nr:MAG: hypothetical protein FRX49_08512 [Trebouxia sp. A1-2]
MASVEMNGTGLQQNDEVVQQNGHAIGTGQQANGDSASGVSHHDVEGGHQPHHHHHLATYSHPWEHRIFQGKAVPDHIKEGKVQYHGFFWRNGKPLHITAVEGEDANGQPFHWSHRRHRKGRLQHHEVAQQEGKPRFHWWRWLAFWNYNNKGPKLAISWWIAWTFFWGSALFTLGSAAALSHKVFLDGTHRASEYDWLIGYPDVFAACFFFWPGVWLLVVENANTDLEMRRHNWEAGGRQGKRPGYRILFPVKVDNLLWWASVLMFAGATGFNISNIAGVLYGDVPLNLTVNQEEWWIYFTITFGASCFVVASIPFCMDGVHSWWRGYFPLTMREVKSLPFWINAWQLWGSIGFLISAAAPYKLDITWKGELIELIFGSLIGSIWFWLNGWGLYLELANPHAD